MKNKKKIIIILSVVLVISTVISTILINKYKAEPIENYSSTPRQSIEKNLPVMKKETPVPTEVKNATSSEPLQELKPSPAESHYIQETPPTPAPVKSIEEIASQYSNLYGNQQYIDCFNKIVERYPERFTPDVRENNIKALTIFFSSCSTGISNLPYAGDKPVIDTYGPNGAFFDSDAAKSRY